MKMLLIGLGKCAGATIYHRAIEDYSFDQIVRSVAGEVLRKCRILAGLAIVENAYDQTALIEAVPPERVRERASRNCCVLARQWMPRLPFPQVDVLLIDRIGKNISGTGLRRQRGRAGSSTTTGPSRARLPKVKRICLRGLTPAHPRQRHRHRPGRVLPLAAAARRPTSHATRLNVLISGHVSAAMLPLDYETDREMLDAALGHGRAGRAAAGPAAVDRQHAGSGRGGVFGGLSRRGPAAERLGDSGGAAGFAVG